MVAVAVAAAVGSTILLLGSSGWSRLWASVLATFGSLLILCWREGILCDILFGLLLTEVLRRHAVMMLGDAVADMVIPREIAVCKSLIVSSPLTKCI